MPTDTTAKELPKPSDDAVALSAQERVALLIARANAAINSSNPMDLNAVQLELGGELGSSEVAVVLSFVQGAITQVQATQLLQTAQTQPDVATLTENAVQSGIITKPQSETIQAVASNQAQAVQTTTLSAGGEGATVTINAGANAAAGVTITADGANVAVAERKPAIAPERVAATKDSAVMAR